MHWHPAEGESIENDYDESTIQAELKIPMMVIIRRIGVTFDTIRFTDFGAMMIK